MKPIRILKQGAIAILALAAFCAVLSLVGCVSVEAQVERRVYAERQKDESLKSNQILATTATHWFTRVADTELKKNEASYLDAKATTSILRDPREAQANAEKYTSKYYQNLLSLAEWDATERARIDSQKAEADQNAEGVIVASKMADNEARVTTTTGRMVLNSAVSLGTGLLSDWMAKAAPPGQTADPKPQPAPDTTTPTAPPTLQ